MNAKRARKITFRNMIKRDKKIIDKINKEIDEATKECKTSISVFKYTDNFDEEKISYYTSLGYDILTNPNGSYKISW